MVQYPQMKEKAFSNPEAALEDTQPRRLPRPDDGAERARLEMLLHQARTASDGDQALEFVQRAVEMHPEDPRVQSHVQLRLFEKLGSDAFLAFLAETEQRYVISFRRSRPISVPKARAEPEPYPPSQRTEAEKALRMMWWMLLGLVPAGIGAVVLSPFAIWHGVRALQRDGHDLRQERMAWAAIFVALGLGILGAFFTALLVLHLLLVG